MAIHAVGAPQQAQTSQKVVKKEDETYDAGTLCYVVCTPSGNTVAGPHRDPEGPPYPGSDVY